MDKDRFTIEEMDDYLEGKLSRPQMDEFERILLVDSAAREQFIQFMTLIEGIKGFGFKEMLKELHKKNFPPEKD